MTEQKIKVKKRDGHFEPLDIAKIHRVVEWAAECLDVSSSQVEINSHIQFYNGISTTDIHETLVKSAADLISTEYPDYQYMAARLALFHIRKIAYGEFVPTRLYKHIQSMIEKGVYDKEILEKYTEEEINAIESFVDHTRDLNFAYAGIKQMESKYLVQNRVTKRVYESPQVAFVLIPTCLFADYPKETRLGYIKKFYDALSLFKISLPTPIMAGVRTPTRQFSSCFPADQQVLTSEGYKFIEDVNVGDMVLTKEGSFSPVKTLTCRQYTGENFIKLKSTLSHRNDFMSTEDHLVWTLPKGESEPKWVEAKDIKIGDYVSIPFNKEIIPLTNVRMIDYVNNPRYTLCDDGYIRKTTSDVRVRSGEYDDKIKPVKNDIVLNNDIFKLMGMYIGNGHCDKNVHCVSFTMNAKDKHKIEFIVNTVKDNFGLNCSISYNNNDHSCKVSVHSYVFKEFILYHLGTGFNKKKISKEVMNSEHDKQLSLLLGVIETDGCLHNSGINIGLSNKFLSKQLTEISLRLKLKPSISFNEPGRKPPITRADGTISEVITREVSYLIFFSIGSNASLIKEYLGNDEARYANYLESSVMVTVPGSEEYSKYIRNNVIFKDDYCFSRVTLAIHLLNETKPMVYDIEVENEHSFTAGSIGVHNCTVIDCDDSLDSINAATSSIVKYISQRAGIGINGGRIRALGSEIRKGEAIHTGVIPFWKMFQAAVKSCSQGGIRGGAATLFYPIWHLEVESLLVLKNNRGVEDNRIRQLDYGVQINKLMYQRLIEDKDITLLSPHSVEGLYDAYFNDQELFEKLYLEAENNPLIPKKTIKATDLFTLLMSERANTGRIYIMNTDHMNTHSSFIEKEATIYTSNLCMEIGLPIKPLNNISDEEGEIALCTLGALNLGMVDKDKLEDIEESMDLIVRALDSVLDYQNYPVKAARNSVNKYRPLGIGVINYAYYLAKNGARYSNSSGHRMTHELFEAIQYYALKSSVQLAKEKGKCGAFENTKYSKGILPIDTYKKSIDEYAPFEYKLDWESLRKDIVQYGLRNATLTSLMPSESSSQVSNATNGIDLPRGPITVKASKDGILKQVVPDYKNLDSSYEYLWYDSNNIGMLKLVAIMQKFVDQSISTNTRYNPVNYPNGKVPMKELLKELLIAYKYGIKTLYYHHTNDGSNDTQDSLDDGCAGGACKI